MTITAPTSGTTSIYSTPATKPANQTMNSQMFLQLLVTQLKEQDPDSPMDSDAMITQTSQLASMQALTSLQSTDSDNFSLQQRTSAAELIGKTANYVDADGNTQSGLVSAVSFTGTTPTLTIGGQTVDFSTVTGLTVPAAAASN
ncbi:MAG TPA: flagellar hook capping FlgD N-terminal domain-containing protein [Galbitalea sp.]|jgi:flagellar basal-body rod modification protein FlgD